MVQHDLDERHQGHRKPGYLPVVAASLATLLVAGCGERRSAPAPPQPQRPILLVSGRDDHGLLVQPRVGLSDTPEGRPRRRVRDGTLVRVIGSSGEWIRVHALEGPPASGWVNDFYLRGTVHLIARKAACPVPVSDTAGAAATRRLPPSAQVEMLAVGHVNGGLWVRARALEGGERAWVPREVIAELAVPPAVLRRSCPQP